MNPVHYKYMNLGRRDRELMQQWLTTVLTPAMIAADVADVFTVTVDGVRFRLYLRDELGQHYMKPDRHDLAAASITLPLFSAPHDLQVTLRAIRPTPEGTR